MSSPSAPLVSIIVPVYNGEPHLDLALKSIFGQDYRPFEVIVIDDGSKDHSADIVKSYQSVRYFYQSNQGVAAARNYGIELAQGEFIAFIDQDDTWLPSKLTRQVEYLLVHSEVDCTITRVKFFLEPAVATPPWLKPDILLRDHPGYFPSALVARRKVFEKLGLFDPGYQMGSDADWFFRAKRHGIPVAVVPETLVRRRIHAANHSYQSGLAMTEILKVVKASIDHQRDRHPKKTPP